MSKQNAERRSKKPKPGRILEMLTARIEGALSGSEVKVKSPDHIPDRVSGGTREVDVSLRSTVGSTDILVIVECRDRGRAADVTWIEQVKSKRDAVGASKAIAVASGTFSKKALAAAGAYGVDARTVAQVHAAEVRRWAGSLEIVERSFGYTDATITVTTAGEPLSKNVSARFDELARAHAFNARFISYPGEEGLLSPLDVVRQRQPVSAVPKGARIKITMPPKSAFVISDDPTMTALIGDPPEDGESAKRRHLIQFEDGEAFFGIDETLRPILSVQLDFTVQLESVTPIDSEAYRYNSSTGIIEVAERTVTLGENHLVLTEHRQMPNALSDATSKQPDSAKK
jgi:hypothetical protein